MNSDSGKLYKVYRAKFISKHFSNLIKIAGIIDIIPMSVDNETRYVIIYVID